MVQLIDTKLIAKGFHQYKGIGFKETFSPVAKPLTIKIWLTPTVQYYWFLNQLDIRMHSPWNFEKRCLYAATCRFY